MENPGGIVLFSQEKTRGRKRKRRLRKGYFFMVPLF